MWYYWVIISAQYITTDNQDLFYNYTRRFSERLESEGYLTLIAIDPEAHTSSGEVIFQPIDYSRFSDIVYSIIFLQYTWGTVLSPPSPVISVKVVSSFLTTILPTVDVDKIVIGIPILGYVWELPYIAGVTDGNSITIDNVVTLALEFGAIIQFDEVSQTPFFYLFEVQGTDNQYIIWYVNALTINSLMNLIVENDVSAIGVWNIMSYMASLWLIINSQYEITKLLPEF